MTTAISAVEQPQVNALRHSDAGGLMAKVNRTMAEMIRAEFAITAGSGRKSIHQILASKPGRRNPPKRFRRQNAEKNSAAPRGTEDPHEKRKNVFVIKSRCGGYGNDRLIQAPSGEASSHASCNSMNLFYPSPV